MKKSINAWSVDSKTGFEEMFQQIKAAGFDGIELNVDAEEGKSAHSLTLSTTDEELAAIKALSEKYQLPVVSISSALWSGRMGSPDAEKRGLSEKLLKKQLQCAKAFGATGILVVPGGTYPAISLEDDRKASAETLASMKDFIAETGIYVGVENVWNGFFMSPLDMASFIDGLDCPFIGAYYDVGNVVAFSWSERWIELLGSRIHNVHVKDFKRNRGINSGGAFVDLLEGDVDWKAVIPALKKAGFDGYLTAEVFKDDDAMSYTDYYKKVADAIGKIIAEY